MIKHLILDMGNVMLQFAPDLFIQDLGISDPEIHSLLRREVFQSLEWSLLDWGMKDEATAAEAICPRLPEELRDTARDLIFRWDDPIRPIPGMADLVRDCKAAGMGVYLLSNASVRLPEYWPRVPGQELFDGIVVSALVRCVKPMPEIYHQVLDTYGLRAEECLFVDDLPMNVAGAAHVGMAGFVFRGNVAELRKEIIRLGGAL